MAASLTAAFVSFRSSYNLGCDVSESYHALSVERRGLEGTYCPEKVACLH